MTGTGATYQTTLRAKVSLYVDLPEAKRDAFLVSQLTILSLLVGCGKCIIDICWINEHVREGRHSLRRLNTDEETRASLGCLGACRTLDC